MKKIIITLATVLFAGVTAFAGTTSTFIPKGTIGGGVTFSYNDYNLGQGLNDAGYSALFSLIGDVHGS